jgi:hypothetical protein
MIAVTCIERKENVFPVLDNGPLPVYPKQDRIEVESDTIRNLITSGVLLPSEAEGYKAILNGYDYDTLSRVFLQSKELKNNMPRRIGTN